MIKSLNKGDKILCMCLFMRQCTKICFLFVWSIFNNYASNFLVIFLCPYHKMKHTCVTGKSKRMQPAWQPPKGDGTVTLKLYNSLTRKKVGTRFVSACVLCTFIMKQIYLCFSLLFLQMYENVIAFYYLKELGLVPDTIICQEECKMENKLV